MIDRYVQNTSEWLSKLRILDVFSVEREGEAERFNPDKLGNK